MEKKMPVGKIDFLDTNGEVGETCYYYTEEEFLKSVKHENYYGAPMVVTVFRDDTYCFLTEIIVSIYKILVSANYEIRDYLATVKKTETKNFEIDVHGLLDQES